MWGRVKKSQGIEENPVRERLASLLGLDLEESGGASSPGGTFRGTELLPKGESKSAPELKGQNSPKSEPLPNSASADYPPSGFDLEHLPEGWTSESNTAAGSGSKATLHEPKPAKTLALDSSAEQNQPDLAGPQALSAAIGALAERVSQHTSETAMRPARQQATTETFAESAPSDMTSPESQRLLEQQTKLFQEQLAGIVNKTLCQSEATVHSSVSRLEAYFAQAKQIESAMDEKLANVTRNAVQAVQTQTKILEGELSKTAEQVGSQIAAALEPVKDWLRTYRAQADEINSALETSLTRFTQKTAEAALVRTRLFQENLAAISEQAISQAQQNLQSRLMELREVGERSLEDSMNSLSERLRQESDSFSTKFLDQMRAKSKETVSELHDRFKSDTEALEAKMVETVQGRLQKLTGEFRSIFDGAFE